MSKLNPELDAVLDEWADAVIKQLSRPRNNIRYPQQRYNQREENQYIQSHTCEVWDESATA